MGVFNKITSGFTLGIKPPIVNGMEDWLYVYNEGDFTLTFDSTNPMIVTGITPVGTGVQLYKFTGTNNSFGASSKSARSQVGPRYVEEIDWNIAGNDTETKAMAMAAGYGRVRAIVVNNYKDGDSVIELYGAICGLIADYERSANDEALEGGYKMKLTQPDKLREPYPPRAIQIAPSGGGSATYASTLAAIEALLTPSV